MSLEGFLHWPHKCPSPPQVCACREAQSPALGSAEPREPSLVYRKGLGAPFFFRRNLNARMSPAHLQQRPEHRRLQATAPSCGQLCPRRPPHGFTLLFHRPPLSPKTPMASSLSALNGIKRPWSLLSVKRKTVFSSNPAVTLEG